MNTQLEHELRRALSTRAAALPPDASAKLLASDYRPRVAARRTPLALATFTVAAAAVLAILLVGLSTAPPRAFAGWSAAPTTAAGDQVSRAGATCRSRLATISGRHTREVGPRSRFGLPFPRFPAGGWRIVLVDTRGPYTMIVLEAEGGRAVASCFVNSHRQASLGVGIGVRPPAPVLRGRVAYASSGSNTTPRDEGSRQFSQVVGRTGAGVTRVTIRLNDGTRVTASCANGWFLAWWPGSHGLSATEVTTATGTRAQ